MLESLSRMTHLRHTPALLCRYIKDYQGEMLPWQREILSILGITNTFFEITRPTAFAAREVPQPGYIIPTEFSEEHNSFLSCIRPEKMIRGKKTYLSRKNIEKTIQTNEEDAEKILRNCGWNVIYPEELSVREQLREISSSEVVLGIEGAVFHNIVFFTGLDTKLYAIHRENNENYVTIARRKHFFYKRIDAGRDGIIDIEKLAYLLKYDCLDQHVISDDDQHRLLCRARLARIAQSSMLCGERLKNLLLSKDRHTCSPGRMEKKKECRSSHRDDTRP
ncbi:glycosyltransferase family 61 protein [uncultured Desulfovibrio sp.]|uniref:glycosyltransferase 61 family protein n=1 Tax=uncultured Desulfovibrio sp. TaxID=167968 RepID=UPI0025E01657|nr:glycosyltransferase family 61 protein [uncultured Desulfovibrio sp.]